ncbi:MAG: FkbM family methyltransferase, partial [Microvirga sp.]|nr:FkbM family methyltransferase [Microvirga sp.]
ANVPERWQVDVVGLLTGKGYRQILETKMNLVFERS